MKRIKQWLIDSFLPMWAKETVLADNRRLQMQVKELEQQIDKQDAYIAGMESGLRAQRRIVIHNGEGKK